MTENNKLQIRNSTVDFLVFTKDAHEDSIEVRVQDHDVWLTQKAIGQLFDVDRSVVTKHLKNIYESGELSEESTCANFEMGCCTRVAIFISRLGYSNFQTCSTTAAWSGRG
jgi:hypothetical protein